MGSGCCEQKTTNSTVYTASQSKVGQRSVCLGEVRGDTQHEVRVVQDSGGSLAGRKDQCCPFQNSTWVLKGQGVDGPEEGCIYSASVQRWTLI